MSYRQVVSIFGPQSYPVAPPSGHTNVAPLMGKLKIALLVRKPKLALPSGQTHVVSLVAKPKWLSLVTNSSAFP